MDINTTILIEILAMQLYVQEAGTPQMNGAMLWDQLTGYDRDQFRMRAKSLISEQGIYV